MMSRPIPIVLPLLAATVAAQASESVTDKIIYEGLENSHVMAFEHYLCNNIGGRLTGSDSFTAACAWALSEFRKMGLDARLEKWGEWKIVWNRGQWSGRVTEPMQLELQVATPAWTAGTRGLVAGTLVAMPKTLEDVEALSETISACYLYGRKPSGKTDDARAVRRAYDDLVEEVPPLGFVTSSRMGMVDRSYKNQIRVFGDHMVALRSWDNLPTTPRIVVRDDQARQLEELLDKGAEIKIEFDIRNRFREGPIALHNVVAELPGSEKPDECVIVCGHLDSWHQAAGATDNGTGTATTMEAARILTAAGAKPKRSIRFILWGGEEQGLMGSNKYVDMHRKEMGKVSAVFNHDNGTNWAHSLTVTEAMYDDFAKVLEPVMKLPSPEADYDGPVFRLRKTKEMSVGGGSDHASFQRAGVPAWPWGLRGRAVYGYGWHSQWDTYDIVIPEYQRHTATVIALTAYGVANLPELLSREGIKRKRDEGGAHSISAYLDRLFGLELEEKMIVKGVRKDGPAARAGVQPGDRIRAVWGEPVSEPMEMFGPWRANRDAKTIDYTVERAGAELGLTGTKEAPVKQGTETGSGTGKKDETEMENSTRRVDR